MDKFDVDLSALRVEITILKLQIRLTRGEWPSGLYSLRQVTEVKLGRVRSDFGMGDL